MYVFNVDKDNVTMLLEQELSILDETRLFMVVTTMFFSVQQWLLTVNNCEQ